MNATAARDIAERAVWTFVQGALSVFTLTTLPTIDTVLIAGAMALLSAVKSFVATKVTGTISPASMVVDR